MKCGLFNPWRYVHSSEGCFGALHQPPYGGAVHCTSHQMVELVTTWCWCTWFGCGFLTTMVTTLYSQWIRIYRLPVSWQHVLQFTEQFCEPKAISAGLSLGAMSATYVQLQPRSKEGRQMTDSAVHCQLGCHCPRLVVLLAHKWNIFSFCLMLFVFDFRLLDWTTLWSHVRSQPKPGVTRAHTEYRAWNTGIDQRAPYTRIHITESETRNRNV